ncbi:SelB C-terminal domain-containing protein [Microbacterium sp.]|uniref:selenocysteine-specific translation elongation factor n=1 Tax=Microbacterium sp. TaxID=51671 RepID=UPI0037CC94C9
MHVIATAGHVDHGKSTLVRTLTGMEPDRLAEEKRRGLTIDLGFVWTTLPSGRGVAFVDVPGHERFLGNMLAGVGPSPAVCFVVAADQGWQAQSSDHRDAIAALGIEHGIVVITRADLASPRQRADTAAQTRGRLAGTPLAHAPIVTVSASERTGLEELVRRLDEMLSRMAPPDPAARVRLWIDRSFTLRGTGTVVTGSLTAGTLRRGDQVELVSADGPRAVSIRGLHSRNTAVEIATPEARVAVNVREIPADAIHRGDALVTPDAWPLVQTADVRRTMGDSFRDAPQQFVAHVGTAAIPARLRPFGDDHARLSLARGVPLEVRDRLVLRSPGGRSVFAGALVLDVDPPPLRRRGDGARREAELTGRPASGDPAAEVARRGAVRPEQLRRFGIRPLDTVPDGVASVHRGGTWWVHPPALHEWARALRAAVERKLRDDPLAPGLTEGAADGILRQAAPPLPDPVLLPLVVDAARLEAHRGVLRPPGHGTDLGEAEAGVAHLEQRLRAHPFAAPEAGDLAALRLGTRELAAAERAGRLLRLDAGVVLLPQAPALAMRHLAALPQPFTTSQARQALDTTRRVAIPLLEHLDARGWTRRVDTLHRTVAR